MFRRACAALLVLATVPLAGCSDTDEQEAAAREAAEDYLDAWASGDLTAAADRTGNSAAALLNLRAIATAMGFGEGEQPLDTEITSVALDEGGAMVGYTATWEFEAAPDWSYAAEIELSAGEGESPTVRWAP